MKIYLIRHGETDWNHLMRFQGRENVPLNEEGIRQAKACGHALSECKIQAVYTSPLIRARRTGEIIAACSKLPETSVFELPELIERDMGIYSGKYMKSQAEFFAISASPDSEGMEPFSQVLKRMKQALQIIARSGLGSAAAVSHGAAINVLLSDLSGGQAGTGKTKLYNGGITILTGSLEEGFRIAACNLPPDSALLQDIDLQK